MREIINTASAPARDAAYERTAPVQAPYVYPDKIMSVEYNGTGANHGYQWPARSAEREYSRNVVMNISIKIAA